MGWDHCTGHGIIVQGLTYAITTYWWDGSELKLATLDRYPAVQTCAGEICNIGYGQ